MSTVAILWALLTLFCIMTEGFYSSLEMALVSFNKVRLQYYIGKGNQRAKWINWLLHHPSRLFGTTLLGVNIAMQLGSECSRRLYTAMDLQADLAPLTQVFLVLIFAELAPIFAARRYSEHMSLLGVPLIYISARVMAPVIWAVTGISRLANRLVGGKEVQSRLFLSRDELMTILQSQDEDTDASEAEELNILARNIFTLRAKTASDIMEPLGRTRLIPSNCTIGHLRTILTDHPSAFLPVFQRRQDNVIGIAYPRDYLREKNEAHVDTLSRSPWFITEDTPLIEIIHQFRRNQQSVAVVLNRPGKAVGILTLDGALEEVFGKITGHPSAPYPIKERKVLVIDKSFPGTMQIEKFNEQYSVYLDPQGKETLSELMVKNLQHQPEVGDSVYLAPFKLTVEQASLLDIKRIRIQTQIK